MSVDTQNAALDEREDILQAIDEFRSKARSDGLTDRVRILTSIMEYIRRGDHEGAVSRACEALAPRKTP
jgi:hypothetical protein